MSDLIDRIQSLEEAVQRIAAKSGSSLSPERIQSMAVEAILDALDASGTLTELGDVDEADLIDLISETLEKLREDWTRQAQRDIARDLVQMVKRAETFYTEQGVEIKGIREAVRRSERAKEITKALDDGLKGITKDLKTAITSGLKDQIARGDIDDSALAARIESESKTDAWRAQVNTRVAVTGYQQVYRNELSKRSGLPHLYYSDREKRNTRAFCRIHKDRVFTIAQVEQMDNAQLMPVSVHRGGFNCIHTWLPVNADWDEALAAKLVEEQTPIEIAIDKQERSKIIVFANTARVTRLKSQLPLDRAGYERIYDADTNDTAFVAIHRKWLDELGRDRRTKKYKRMIAIRDRALELSEQGRIVRLDLSDDYDLIVDGEERMLADLD